MNSTEQTTFAAAARLVVVGRVNVVHKLTSPVRVEIIAKIIGLLLHALAHLVKRRSRNEVALAVHLPGDGRKLRANVVVALGTRGRSSVDGKVDSLVLFLVNNHAGEEITVVVGFVVDDNKGLRLHSNLRGRVSDLTAEDTIVKWRLVLPRRVALSSSTVRPMNLKHKRK